MRNAIMRACGAAILVLLGGCTTSLSTRPDFNRTSSHDALPGISYALPMLQYEIKATYKIVDCPRAAVGADPKSDLDMTVEATATSGYVAGERYVIDYRALGNKLKITDFSIETHPGSGTLKAINASAEDKTGDVIKAVVDTAVTGASLATGVPATPQSVTPAEAAAAAFVKNATVQKVKLVCNDDAQRLTTDSVTARKRVKELIKLLEQGGKEADTLAVRATLKLSDANDAIKLLKLHESQLALSKELTELQAKLAENDGKLTFTETTRWPGAFDTTPGPITSSELFKAWADKWVDVDIAPYSATDPVKLAAAIDQLDASPKAAAPEAAKLATDTISILKVTLEGVAADDGCDIGEEASRCARRRLGLYASLETDQAAPPECKKVKFGVPCLVENGFTPARDATNDKGIFIREPVLARLVLCDRDKACANTKVKPIFEGSMVMAPQKGQLRFLQFSNGPFQNNVLGVSLRLDGGIEKMQYSEKSAVMAGALASISASASKVDAYLKAQEAARDKAEADAKAEIAANRAEAKAIRDDQLSQLQFQRDKFATEKAIHDQLNPPPPEEPAVSKEYANETLRLQAELTRANTLIGIKEAQAKFAALP
ncbi:hypothetical protein J2W22_000249 [Sphingomonas kyeonggiensis]|uniref:hypothetical protein n=1 Tax=Sphingomonas kyeonggiensis TaxID=1268553 RepID=UPI00278B0DB1|nr:hypothetical protein [Sphingomonas kyeonggiensis]MDQ0248202.1 hypothetical protein [Sphingomonas kyeonggiensis]